MKSRFIRMAGLWAAVLAMVTALPAQDDAKPRFGAFEAAGFQANSSAPFVFEGKPVGIVACNLVFIGTGKSFKVSGAGTLYLGINDGIVGDNSGGFNLTVTGP